MAASRAVYSKEFTWVKISSTSMSSSFFAFTGLSRSRYKEHRAHLSLAIPERTLLQWKYKMKKYLYNIYFYFRSVTRFAKIWLLFPHNPPASFPSYNCSWQGLTEQNQLQVWVIWSHTWDQNFSPGTRSDHVLVCVFHTELLCLFLEQYCLDPLILN